MQTEAATSNIRRIAEGRHHALGHVDPAVQNTSAAVWWIAFREGANWALTSSAKMSSLFQDVGEWIAVLAESRPRACPHCGGVLDE